MKSVNKIVFIINVLEIGGAAKMIKCVADWSADWFQEVHMVSLFDNKLDEALNPNIVYHPLGIDINNNRFWRFQAAVKLRKLVKEISPVIVCSFVSDVCVLARLSTLGLNIKFVSSERGNPNNLSTLWKSLVSFAYQTSDACIFQLEQARDFFGKRVVDKSFVIPNVTEVKSLSSSTKVRKKTVVSAGRFVEEKRYDLLIRAFYEVNKVHPDYKLIIYGSGPLLPMYQNLVDKLGLQQSVTFPGYVSDVSVAIQNEGIFVLSSSSEGIPNSLIEALAAGVPTVSTDCTPGGPAFLTQSGQNGLLIPVNDVDAMSKAIIRIIESPELQEKLSKSGSKILSTLSSENIYKMWQSAFQAILNS